MQGTIGQASWMAAGRGGMLGASSSIPSLIGRGKNEAVVLPYASCLNSIEESKLDMLDMLDIMTEIDRPFHQTRKHATRDDERFG